jgi:hypothetical protein
LLLLLLLGVNTLRAILYDIGIYSKVSCKILEYIQSASFDVTRIRVSFNNWSIMFGWPKICLRTRRVEFVSPFYFLLGLINISWIFYRVWVVMCHS